MESQGEPAASPRGTKRKASDDLPRGSRKIQPLAQDVINKIAAGEIIVAPVHALKELIENSVDAGATQLEVVVKDGGLKLLQITDNGHGIDKDDLSLLCERFTTSKLKAFEDLQSIETYGFRGEALASISHIAHLTVVTRTAESSCAWRAQYADGKLVPPKPGQSAEPKSQAGRQGTQITVEDLFYSIPTRRRAFRSHSEEYAKIIDMVGRHAIHCAHVGFSCKKHGESARSLQIPVNASTVDRIRAVHGTQIANEVVHWTTSNERWGFKADAWVSNANYSVKKTILLLFINHRAVESSAIKKAIDATYATFLPKGGHPFVYLSLEIEPNRVDVNVHPTKREVNFLNEDEIIEAICDEIRSELAKVDTSRTFLTQTLLPGSRLDTPARSAKKSGQPSPDIPSIGGAPKFTPKTPAQRPYENNLVRTDAKSRKITTMFTPTHIGEAGSSHQASRAPPDEMEYERTDREYTSCKLVSIRDLRQEVREAMHNELTDVFSELIFIGVVDIRRRIAAIQSGVKLFLVDYGMVSNEYFYQVGLTDFMNFGRLRLDPPLNLRELLEIGAAYEREQSQTIQDEDSMDQGEEIDWDEVVETVMQQLIARREMLTEYLMIDISEDGELGSLPLLVKGYTPSMAKLPTFLLRLGPHVDWTDEKQCFQTFLTELASFYTPEALPSAPDPVDSAQVQMEDAEIVGRRNELAKAVEHVLFPAFRGRIVATKGLLKGVVEIANLKGLYRVFERC
ncbi:DNA mismatch repair protein MutL [Eremomyces bilateralis CBS 781.70]|uniref:DNA mismatch repair protein MutL n=1 Tax=Eremomyces bilateralis CBS 781.70 TaxID=1392243 RepID=A0A6G1GG76_9PEZI|nr:DNA mismatch repair protein MutL [Eremomyces bilateralis CBS 781.70]KAF1816911.1 DNA mismatch repair protein MutL [Eremomyces bilateralis CBS 781.70]